LTHTVLQYTVDKMDECKHLPVITAQLLAGLNQTQVWMSTLSFYQVSDAGENSKQDKDNRST